MRLEVPYHSQEEQDAKHFANDCGAACASMVLEWAGKGRISVNSLARHSSLASSDTGLSPKSVQKMLTGNGVDAEVRVDQTAESILNEIDEKGRPVIALINYAKIPERMGYADWYGGHFVVVVGSEDDTVYFNDPDFWGSQLMRGRNLPVKRREFESALASAPIRGCAIFAVGEPEEAPSEGDNAGTGAGVAPPHAAIEPRRADRRVPVGAALVVGDPLWLRAVPAGSRIRLLSHAEKVAIVDRAPVVEKLNGREYVWVYVFAEDESEGWCAEDFLVEAAAEN